MTVGQDGGPLSEGASEPKRTLDRRTLIKGAAAAGVVGWAAPVIIDSMVSPAAAESVGFTCSFATIVFTTASGIFAVKMQTGTTVCTLTNTTAASTTLNPTTCNSHSYSNTCGGGGSPICRDGTAVTIYPGPGCPYTANGSTITAHSPVTSTLFVFWHNGQNTASTCGPSSPFSCPL